MICATFQLLYVVPLLPLLLFYIHGKRKQLRIKQWQKSLNLAEHAQFFQRLYQHENGFILSQQARKKRDAIDYVYGEITFLSFLALLSLTKPDENTVFYDLGCGIGKAVLACAMVFPIRKSVGVEILPELYFSACKQAKKLASIKNYAEQTKKIEFILGDFLKVNLDEATIIFINSTALFNPTWKTLCARLEYLPHLTTVITTSKALPSKLF
ncbi:class I SAM-dependent methyltransferase [Legionella drancourtii]|uniref:Histone-lysine N-methyltransferase, H3 lysine-79 specific n=1 Tax=Legionella drancourtii LLAP12 TaxID=658187 RepID=G9EJS4_9GAMM|nr:hypothetical protein [Legionella drancourtii]EHL32484.1 hypothetical protein LDG_5440 [Legionella drancourtii LLAP12]